MVIICLVIVFQWAQNFILFILEKHSLNITQSSPKWFSAIIYFYYLS
jgi:hypothetical protein